MNRFFCLIFFLSCTTTSTSSEEFVPKKMYDELLSKYQKLQMENNKPTGDVQVKDLVIKNNDAEEKEKDLAAIVVKDESIDKLNEANQYIVDGNFDKALSILQPLSKDSNPQIMVQAKFLLAEMFYTQKEYDLAMQIYEEIITTNAFSGIVINVLQRLVDCCEKLNLPEKKMKYSSLLTDIFNKE